MANFGHYGGDFRLYSGDREIRSRIWSLLDYPGELTALAFRTDMKTIHYSMNTYLISSIVWAPIQYVTLQFQDQHSAGSLHYRNHAKITVHMCEEKPYPMRFSYRRKSYPI